MIKYLLNRITKKALQSRCDATSVPC